MNRTDSRIDSWMRRLIDLTRRNRLLFFTPTRRSSLQVIEPSPCEVFQRLVVNERSWKFFIPPEDNDESVQQPSELALPFIPATGEEQLSPPPFRRRPDELLCTTREGRTLRTTLRALYRCSRTDFEERGVHILYVTFGIIEGQEAQGTQPTRSPLLMVPTRILRQSA